MRLKTAIWVQAYLRRCASAGAFAAVVRHGDDHSGAIFIKVNLLNGTCHLYCPAPTGLDGAETERRWILDASREGGAEAVIDARLVRERGFDSDLWVIEIEDRAGRHFLDDSLVA